MTRTLTALLAASGLALAAPALSLRLADGKEIAAEPVSFDEGSVTLRWNGAERTLSWDELEPQSAYLARKTLVPYDDPAGRRDLSRFAADLRLYPEAVEQLEIGLALGGLSETEFEQALDELSAAEVEYLDAKVEALLETEEAPEAALAAIRRLKERYPGHPAARRHEREVPRLVALVAAQQKAEAAAGDEAEQSAALQALKERIDRYEEAKAKALKEAAELHKEGEEAAAKGQISRTRKRLTGRFGAEHKYKEARAALRAMARLDRGFRVLDKKELQAEYAAVERKLVDCYLHVARSLLSQRNYKGAVEWVRKVLLYDPIHEEALEMVEVIRKNRIHFKVSDISNVRPRVSGG